MRPLQQITSKYFRLRYGEYSEVIPIDSEKQDEVCGKKNEHMMKFDRKDFFNDKFMENIMSAVVLTIFNP